jgi:hypothetical protein
MDTKPVPVLSYKRSKKRSDIRGARHSHMRELRVQHKGRPYRMLYADKGYDYRHLRLALRKRRIIPCIACCGVEPKTMSESSNYPVFKGPATL